MNKENQLLLIEKFLNSNEETILINRVNDELSIFYLSIIKYYADKQSIKLKIDEKSEVIMIEDDLFGQKEIKIFSITNTKILNSALKSHDKKIIFTDYKNYKNLRSKYICVNGYKFEFDLMFFIKQELKINNDELFNYCKNNPALIFSETSKYLINNNRYTTDQKLVDEKNHILNIRKLIFETKKSSLNIKNLYFYIKKEASYKKLNFSLLIKKLYCSKLL